MAEGVLVIFVLFIDRDRIGSRNIDECCPSY